MPRSYSFNTLIQLKIKNMATMATMSSGLANILFILPS